MNKPPVLIFVILVLLGSLGAIVYSLRPRRLPYNPGFDECIGAKLAEEAVRLLQGKGDIVVLNNPGDDALTRAQLRGLRHALESQAGIKILAVDGPRWDDPNEAETPNGLAGPFWERILTQYPNAAALVSFIGVPDNSEGPFSRLDPSKLPAVVALSVRRMQGSDGLLASRVPCSILRDRTTAKEAAAPPSRECANYQAVSNQPRQ